MAKKPKYPVPQTDAEFAALHAELEKLALKHEGIQLQLNKEVNALIVAANQKAKAVSEEFALKFAAIKAGATEHKETMTDGGKRRTVSLPTGALGWRATPAGISVPRTAAEVAKLIARLLAARKGKFLRRRWELNVEAMEANWEEATAIEGIKRRSASETFFVKFRSGDEITQKIKLKTPSGKDVPEGE